MGPAAATAIARAQPLAEPLAEPLAQPRTAVTAPLYLFCVVQLPARRRSCWYRAERIRSFNL
jgi:hypothetical protein